MTRDEALAMFLAKARSLANQLERAVQSEEDRRAYPNAEIALRNVRSWIRRAESGTLACPAGTAGFGISKSDLLFGLAEKPLYELEQIYVTHLSDA